MELLYVEDCPKYDVGAKGMILQGFSKAGDRTGFVLFPHKFLFDGGVRTRKSYPYIFNTHCHADHTGELPYICNKHKLFERSNYEIFTPASTAKYITKLIVAISHISNPEHDETVNATNDNFASIYEQSDINTLIRQRISINSVNAGDKFMVNGYEIMVMEAHHTVQAVGYGISSFKNKMKIEYQHMSSHEIKELRKNGTEISEKVRDPEIVFFCDSSIENLTLHEEWKEYPVIVCECTGLDDKILTDRGHTNINELLPILLENKDKKWIIIHTSTSMKSDNLRIIETDLRKKGLDIQLIG